MTDTLIERSLEDPDYGIALLQKLKAEKEKRKALEVENKALGNALEDKTIQLNEDMKWYSIKRLAKINDIDSKKLSYRKLIIASKARGYEIKKVFD